MIQDLLRQILAPVYPVHELERSVGFGSLAARPQPVYEPFCLFCESDAQEPVEGECRIPEPGVAVVPVALSTEVLRQTHGGGCHYSSCRLESEQLQGQGKRGTILPQAPRQGE